MSYALNPDYAGVEVPRDLRQLLGRGLLTSERIDELLPIIAQPAVVVTVVEVLL